MLEEDTPVNEIIVSKAKLRDAGMKSRRGERRGEEKIFENSAAVDYKSIFKLLMSIFLCYFNLEISHLKL